MKKVLFIALAAAAFAAISCDKANPADPNTVEWQGVVYKTVTLNNGQTWMAENLRALPDGALVSGTPGDDAAAWFPYELVEDSAKPGSYVANALKDEASIKKYGYIYRFETIYGVNKLTKDNYQNFEGAQGICPDGWHVPTRADFIALCGYADKIGSETVAPTNPEAPFWMADPADESGKYCYGSVKKANECGWNYIPAGSVGNSAYSVAAVKAENTEMKELAGRPSMAVFASSTGAKFTEKNTKGEVINQITMSVMQSTFTLTKYNEKTSAFNGYSYGRLAVSGSIAAQESGKIAGASVRCIKNAEKKK